jgi:hypothetical protein
MSPAMNWSDRAKIASEATSSFTPLEEGTYSFIIKEPAKPAEKNGWQNYTINPSVEAGPRQNARIFHTFYTTEKPNGMRMFFEQMAVFGLTEEWFAQTNPTDAQICAALQGKRFTAEVYIDRYNDKEYRKLRKFAPPVGVAAAAGAPGPAAVAPAAPAAPAAPVAPAAPAAPAAAAAPANPWANVAVPTPPANPFA